jgi:pimeloyl-ACP methyl ester carboxylesterase
MEEGVLGPRETTEGLVNVFKKHNLPPAVFIGHSYGTIMQTWVVKAAPKLVHSMIMIDPVCIELQEADIVVRFFHRLPANLSHLLIYVVGTTDLGIARTISRHFWWFENTFFMQSDLQKLTCSSCTQQPASSGSSSSDCRLFVFLSGRDQLTNAELVRQTLLHHNVPFYWTPTHSHASFLMYPESWKEIVSRFPKTETITTH